MKSSPYPLKVAWKATISIMLLAFIALTSCKKDSVSKTTPEGIRQTGYDVGDVGTDGTGTNNGYFWSLYQEGGSASITFPNGGGNFQISYSNVNDVVGGKGWNPGSSRNIGYNVGYLTGNYNFIGIYGWARNPLIEYYVAERGSMVGGTSFGNVSSDGHNYSCYKSQRVNAPSIEGTRTFWQYKDTWGGAPTGTNMNVNMANHINNWRSRGGQGFGNFDYMILAIEAWGNRSGTINATVW